MEIFKVKKLAEIISQVKKKKAMSPSAVELLNSLRGKKSLINNKKNELESPIKDYFRLLEEATSELSKGNYEKAQVKLEDAYQTTEVIQQITDKLKEFMLSNKK